MKYFILLETTAVLSLESKYENTVVSSQSSATICSIRTEIIKAVNKEHTVVKNIDDSDTTKL